MPSIAERLAAVRGQIAGAADACGRSAEEIRLLAVSKTKPIEAIEEAYRAGQRDFGENYAQELAQKAEALAHYGDIRWHMIGHLQRNKAKLVAEHASAIHTVDDPRLVRELAKRVTSNAESRGRLVVFVQVNVAGEAQKAGCAPDELEAILGAVESEAALELAGLMTIPPQSERPEDAVSVFEALAQLRNAHGGVARLPELSMGMSHDFVQAIQAGATLVRVGSRIFGERAAKTSEP